MPGIDLALDVPSVDDTLEDIVTAISTALSTIETDLADRIVSSEIDIDDDLSMNEYALINAGSAILTSGTVPTAEGSVYYHTDNEFYLLTGDGTARVTNNGALDFVAENGFTGDYGDDTETAAYSNAAGEFRFTEDVGVPADLVADDVIVQSPTGGSVRFGVANAVTDDLEFQLSSLPTSGVSALEYDGGDFGVKDNNATRLTNTAKFTDVDMSGTLRHGDVTVANYMRNFLVDNVGGGISTIAPSVSPTKLLPFLQGLHSGTPPEIQIHLQLPIGARLKEVRMTHTGGGTWTPGHIAPRLHNTFPVSQTTIAGTLATVTGGGGLSAATLETLTITTPTPLTAGQMIYLHITWPSSDTLVWLDYTYDKTA
jgi:hypothetical protein